MSYEDNIVVSHDELKYNNIFIKGTNISVSTVLRELSEGNSKENIIIKHPEISVSDIYSCLEFAAELVGVIDFNKSISAINVEKKKRKVLIERLRAMKGNPPPAFR